MLELFKVLNERNHKMKKTLKEAIIATLPVMSGYLVLGFGFGLIVKSAGFGILIATVMSLSIYAGSMQYVAIGLFTGGASLITVAITTLMVNARHLFYGISMLDKYRGVGKIKPYLIFSLTDETYSLVCDGAPSIPEEEKRSYYLFVSVLNHFYWVAGSFIGAVAGTLLSFNTEGVDFALTALFLTVMLEQWLTAKSHFPALTGLLVSIASLLIFGRDSFLIPAMLIIALILLLPINSDEREEAK